MPAGIKMTHDEMIAVIQAHKEGKKIEYGNGEYCNFEQLLRNCDYRVKPEPLKPREFWIGFHSDKPIENWSCISRTPYGAALNNCDAKEIIHVREVLE